MCTFKVPARLLVTPSSCYCYSRADQTLTMRYYTAICQFIRHFHFTFHPKRRRRSLRAANPEKCPKKRSDDYVCCLVDDRQVKRTNLRSERISRDDCNASGECRECISLSLTMSVTASWAPLRLMTWLRRIYKHVYLTECFSICWSAVITSLRLWAYACFMMSMGVVIYRPMQ